MNFHISAGVRGRRGQILWGNPLKKDEIAEITRLRLPDRNVPALGLRSATHAPRTPGTERSLSVEEKTSER